MRTRHHNPLHLIAVAGLVMILVAAYQDPDLSRYLVHWPGAVKAFTITNGMDAINVLGKADFTSSGAETTQSGTNDTEGVGYDSVNNRLFIADTSNNRTLVFDLSGGITDGMNATNVLGQSDFVTGSAGTTSSISMSLPSKIFADTGNNRLFVTDTGNCRILVFDVSGGITDGMNATNVLGQSNFGPIVNCVTTQSGLKTPKGTAYDSVNQYLFVADALNNRTLVFNLSGGITNGMNASFVLGQADFTSGGAATTQTRMRNPNDVVYDGVNERLFVADDDNNRVLVFDTSGGISNGASASFVLGQTLFTTATGGVSQSGMRNPVGLTYDSANSLLYVALAALNHRVLVFDLSGGITNGMNASYVLGQANFTSNTSATTQSGMNTASGVEYDSVNDRLFVADYGSQRTLVFGASAAVVSVGGAGVPPQPPGFTGFFPLRIIVNEDATSTDSRNVLVQAYADFSDSFTGTVDLMLSNTPDFSTFLPFRYVINDAITDRTTWPQTIAWDLCFGLPEDQSCDPGQKIVYARFYPNIPAPTPALPTASLVGSPESSASMVPVPTTPVPSPGACPTDCRQIGLYNPSEVTNAGCTFSKVQEGAVCLVTDPTTTCQTIYRAAGPTCFVPDSYTNYCFRCP